MMRGRVIGQVWGARHARGLDGRRLLLVALTGAAGGASEDRVVVAIDTLDARVGDDALIAFGSGARNVLAPGPDHRDLLCDAAVAVIVDGAG